MRVRIEVEEAGVNGGSRRLTMALVISDAKDGNSCNRMQNQTGRKRVLEDSSLETELAPPSLLIASPLPKSSAIGNSGNKSSSKKKNKKLRKG